MQDGALRHEDDQHQHDGVGSGDGVVQTGQTVLGHGVGEDDHDDGHQADEQDVHVPGSLVRVFGAGDRGIAASQAQAGADAGDAAHGSQPVDVLNRGRADVGNDHQHGAAQRQGAPRSAAHGGGDHQRGEHGEDELSGHQEAGLGGIQLEVVHDRAD
ncbi:hypothetical protein D3C78_1187250 [compost metagenome]